MKLAIIPARGGSKRIPRKNIKYFHGKPMIAYAVLAAVASNLFDKIIISTEDDEIAQIAQNYGAEVPFMRPTELADDLTPTVPVIAHAIRTCSDMGWNVEYACCIYPSVPFIVASDLCSAYNQLIATNANFIFPITRFPSPVQRALRRLPNGTVKPFQPEFASTRTQDLELSYFDAGQFYWGKSSSWLEGLNVHCNGATLVIPEWRVVDIDTLSDWERAELLYQALHVNGLL